MSVYTPVTLSEAQQFADCYALHVTAMTPIQAGIENTNYFLHLEDQPDVVLTIFEEMNMNDIHELIPLLDHLKQQDMPVAAPLQAQDGQPLHFIKNKPAQLAPRLLGQPPMQPTLSQVQHMAVTLAKLHIALGSYPLHRDNNHGQAWWQDTKAQLQPKLTLQDQHLLEQAFQQFAQVQQDYPNRPYGLIHGDLFRDNTLFQGECLTGVLDFSELSFDELLLDIAICLNDFCSQWPAVDLNAEYAQEFIHSYHQVRPLTQDEQKALPAYLVMAACRFWLSRLQVALRNQQESRIGKHILQKDPNEMRDMVHRRLVSPFYCILQD